MRITYIFHSGFAIECTGFSMLFDYCKDSGKNPTRGFVHDTLLKKPGPLYVFSSHSHPDHFNKDILQWKAQKPDITYILADEIRVKKKLNFPDAVYLKKGEQYRDEHISTEAFGSTDIGISFLIEAEGKSIFHAGDLNNWHWRDESTAAEIKEAGDAYLQELHDLTARTRHINIVFFPVDPRLGTDFMQGARQFIDAIRTDVFIPMHFWERPAETEVFAPYAEQKGCRYILMPYPGEGTDV